MPSKKKKSKGKARKAAAKGVSKHGDIEEEANEQKQGTLDSHMQRLQIEDKQQAQEDALLEEAIKLAAAEKKDIEEEDVMCCANCGITEVDNVKLSICPACKLVRYCSDTCLRATCQREHRPNHKTDCKVKEAVLRDERLFQIPEGTHEGECPICFLPIPLDCSKSTLMACCSKTICYGCIFENVYHEGLEEPPDGQRCLLCRQPPPSTDEEMEKYEKERLEANDPIALCRKGKALYFGGDCKAALEYYTLAAGQGHAEAHFALSTIYREQMWKASEEKDHEKGKIACKKMIHHQEEAAMGGHPTARYNHGCDEWNRGRYGRAVRHWTIVAFQGHDGGVERLKAACEEGAVRKMDVDVAVCGYKAAIDATKSAQRDKADETLKRLRMHGLR